jgi:hypothetical protein
VALNLQSTYGMHSGRVVLAFKTLRKHQQKSLENIMLTIYKCITISLQHILSLQITKYYSQLSLQLHAGDIAALGWWDLFINFGYDSFLFTVMFDDGIFSLCLLK